MPDDRRPIDRSSWKAIQEAADKAAPGWQQTILDNWDLIREAIDPTLLEQALSMGAGENVVNGIDWQDDQAGKAFAEKAIALVSQAGQLAGVGVRLRFDMTNPETLKFINSYSFDLIRGLNEVSKEGIRAVMRDAQIQGLHPRQQAKTIKTMIGLDERRAGALNKWTANLRAKNPKASEEWISSRVQTQSDKLLLDRAKTISRTETIRVSAMGQQEAWRQALEEGLLDSENTVRVWITTKDDRTCPWCASLDGAVAAMEGEWSASVALASGQLRTQTALTPPLHTKCRCAMGLEIMDAMPGGHGLAAD